MGIVIGVIGIIVGIAGVIVGWVALTKVQTLSVAFVKSHIQGIRIETAKNSTKINMIINKLEILEKANSKADDTDKGEAISGAQASTH